MQVKICDVCKDPNNLEGVKKLVIQIDNSTKFSGDVCPACAEKHFAIIPKLIADKKASRSSKSGLKQ